MSVRCGLVQSLAMAWQHAADDSHGVMNASSPLPGTSVLTVALPPQQRPALPPGMAPSVAVHARLATITKHMRLNFFAPRENPEPARPSGHMPGQPAVPPASQPSPVGPQARSGKTYPADMVVWGIVIRDGFDELDDPFYHRGVTQHAYVEGADSSAICGFQPPLSGPRSRRRPRLGLPSAGEHPMCGMCARLVVAPRPRVPIPVAPFRPALAVPVTRGAMAPAPIPVPVAPRTNVAATSTGAHAPTAGAAFNTNPAPRPTGSPTSPWVQRATGAPAPQPQGMPLPSSHDGGLLARGVNIDDPAR
jgi:hypothetical protein